MREASFSLPLLMNWWALAEEALVGLLMKGDCVCVCACVCVCVCVLEGGYS